jgi:hypothetical protein
MGDSSTSSMIIKQETAGHWWLTPIILATQEAKFRRTLVRSQPWAKSAQAPIFKKLITKRAGGMTQGVDPEFKPQYHKK